ncbi:putative pentatricopeptide repeat-containing protein [Drosera capensis]
MAKLRQPISPYRLSSLLRQEKNPKIALQLFLNPNPNPDPNLKPFRHSLLSYDLIITKLGRAKLFYELDQILARLKLETRFAPPEIIFCNVITFYANRRLPDKAIEVYDSIPSFRCLRTAKSLNSLMNGMLLCGEWDHMRRIFYGFERFACPDACSYNVMIRGFRVLGDVDGARKMFDEMRVRGVCPDEVTFGVMMETLCEGFRVKEAFMMNREGREDEVKGVLKEMKRNGCRPDDGTYNALVTGFCKNEDFESALKVLGEMDKRKLKPYLTTCNTLLHGFCKGRMMNEAVDLFQDMPRLGCNPYEVAYRILLNGLLDDLKLEDAATLLDEMIFKGFHPTSGSISKLMDLLIQQGNAKMLSIVLNSLAKGNHVDANTWSMAVSTATHPSSRSDLGALRYRRGLTGLNSILWEESAASKLEHCHSCGGLDV